MPKFLQPSLTWLALLALSFAAAHCARSTHDGMNQKIGFDTSAIDANGLRNGEVALDYEYCIPATADAESDVRKIDPDVRLMKQSRGRIGCAPTQWLCISSTHHGDWKKRLERIAALPYVERIIETHYE
jgi:hypothetical protein